MAGVPGAAGYAHPGDHLVDHLVRIAFAIDRAFAMREANTGELAQLDGMLAEHDARMAERVAASRAAGMILPVLVIAERFGLGRDSVGLLIAAALPGLDVTLAARWQVLVGSAEPERRVHELVDLVAPHDGPAALAELACARPLRRGRLVRLASSRDWAHDAPLLQRLVTVPDCVVDALRGELALDRQLALVAHHQPPAAHTDAAAVLALGELVAARPAQGVVVIGPALVGKATAIATAAWRAGRGTLVGRLDVIAAAGDAQRWLDELECQSRLLGDVLVLRAGAGFDALPLPMRRQVIDLVDRGAAVLTARDAGVVRDLRAPRVVTVATPDAAMQAEVWREQLHGAPADVASIIARCPLPIGEIMEAAAQVRSADRAPSTAAVLDAARARLQHRLGDVAAVVTTTLGWTDLVVREDIAQRILEILAAVHHKHHVLETWGFDGKLPYGRGGRALLSGPPGTGKTMVASLLAKELGLELYRIDLSQVVNKYIGETEKNLGACSTRPTRVARDAVVRRGRLAVREAHRRQVEQRSLREPRGQLPAPAHGVRTTASSCSRRTSRARSTTRSSAASGSGSSSRCPTRRSARRCGAHDAAAGAARRGRRSRRDRAALRAGRRLHQERGGARRVRRRRTRRARDRPGHPPACRDARVDRARQPSHLSEEPCLNKNQETQEERDAMKALGSAVAAGESKGDYEAYNSGTYKAANGKNKVGVVGRKDMSRMTIDQIIQSAKTRTAHDPERVRAAGKYQIITPTLESAKRTLHLPGSLLFTNELQEKIFMEFLIGKANAPVTAKYIKQGIGGSDDAVYEIAKIWRSVEVPLGRKLSSGAPSNGHVTYAADGNVAAVGSGKRIKAAVEQARAAYAAARGGDAPLVEPQPIPETRTTTPTAPSSQTGPQEASAKAAPKAAHDPKPPVAKPGHLITDSVGRGGKNHAADVEAVQHALDAHGHSPGAIDHLVGPRTVHAIERFQHGFMKHPDGLIEVGRTTEHHLMGAATGRAKPPASRKTAAPKIEATQPDQAASGATRQAKQAEETRAIKEAAPESPSASYEAIRSNFHAAIPGSSFTWHDALYLPSWNVYAKPSDLQGISFETVSSNIERQAAALQRLSAHFGKKIHVNCWLRPPAYNRAIGGVSNSAHLRGSATDFRLEGMDSEAVRKVLKANPGIYPGAGENGVPWLHLDLEHKTWFPKK